MSTGQPDTDSTAADPVPPSVPPPLPQAVAVVLAAVSVVMIVGGGVVAMTGPAVPGLVPALPGPQSTQPLPPVPGPTTGISTPSPEPSPSGPDALAALSETDADAELRRQAAADAEQVAALAGSWVPQVSSKCAGLAADIGPGWTPDGHAETGSVTAAQIAAFHASLRQRFGALTARQTAVGISRDTGKSDGDCPGLMVWMSLVPQSFSSAPSANSWCDSNSLPPRECGARLVAPGGKSRFVGRD